MYKLYPYIIIYIYYLSTHTHIHTHTHTHAFIVFYLLGELWKGADGVARFDGVASDEPLNYES